MSASDGSGSDMNEFRPTPSDLDDNTAERLLSGQIDAADAPPGYGRVAEVLAAATASANPSELAGESDALTMFRLQLQQRSAVEGAAVVSLDEHRSRGVSRKAMLVGVVAGVLLASTGVAAAGGDLPEPVQRVAHQTLSHIGVPVPDPQPKPAKAPAPADQRAKPATKPEPSSATPPMRSSQEGTPSSKAPRTAEPSPTGSTPPSTATPPTVPPSAPPSTALSQPPTRGPNPGPTVP